MRTYVRNRTAGGCYFFTVNLAARRGNRLLVEHIDALREAFRATLSVHPARMDAIVVLPEHLHCLWRLPFDDADHSMRWRLIKSRFSRAVEPSETITPSRRRKGERGIWQRRYWEHLIRDDADYARHFHYIHYNPVKHGHVRRASDWPHSTFRRWVARGVYDEDWAAEEDLRGCDLE